MPNYKIELNNSRDKPAAYNLIKGLKSNIEHSHYDPRPTVQLRETTVFVTDFPLPLQGLENIIIRSFQRMPRLRIKEIK